MVSKPAMCDLQGLDWEAEWTCVPVSAWMHLPRIGVGDLESLHLAGFGLWDCGHFASILPCLFFFLLSFPTVLTFSIEDSC